MTSFQLKLDQLVTPPLVLGFYRPDALLHQTSSVNALIEKHSTEPNQGPTTHHSHHPF